MRDHEQRTPRQELNWNKGLGVGMWVVAKGRLKYNKMKWILCALFMVFSRNIYKHNRIIINIVNMNLKGFRKVFLSFEWYFVTLTRFPTPPPPPLSHSLFCFYLLNRGEILSHPIVYVVTFVLQYSYGNEWAKVSSLFKGGEKGSQSPNCYGIKRFRVTRWSNLQCTNIIQYLQCTCSFIRLLTLGGTPLEAMQR